MRYPDDPLYEKGAVNPRRQWFMTLNAPQWAAADEEMIRQVAAKLGHPPTYIDADGYEIEVTAGIVDPQQDRLAWVVCRAKELGVHPLTGEPAHNVDVAFHLRATINGQTVINWEPYTYNPYFGCTVGYIAWHGDHIVMIYREKHDTYVAAAHIDGSVKWVVVEDRWTVQNNIVGHMAWDADQVWRLAIPELTPLAAFSRDEAIDAGFLSADA